MTWIDQENKHRDDCIDCGKNAGEGNRCYPCWQNAGRPMTWNNKDIPKNTVKEKGLEGKK